MFAISKFSVIQFVLVNLIAIFIVVTGTVSFFMLPRELFPFVSADFVFVTTLYPRASADEVEKSITVLIEEEISDVRGLKKLSSTTVEGRSLVIVEVDTDRGYTTDKVKRDIETEIDKITQDLPKESEKPVVTEFVFDFPIMTVSVSGTVTEHELKQVSNEIKDRLKLIRGVSDVDVVGERDEEIWVEIDPLRLYGYHLTLEDLRLAIAQGGLDLAAGLARSTKKESIVRTKELYSNPEDVKRVVIKADNGLGRVRVGDIATLTDTFEEATTLGRLDGERCINLDIKQRPGGDTIKIAEAVKQSLNEIRETLPYGINTKVNRDLSFMVSERLELLTQNGLFGLFLCLFMLRLFLNSRMALMTGLGIPFAFMGGLLLMSFFGISFNMISMFALIMVLGMLVDDGIVVTENSYRYIQAGIDPVTSAIRGSGEVFWSVVASVTTTIAAFLPILMMTGIMGKFCRSIPLVVTFTLLASLLEALVVLPCHLAEWSHPTDWRRVWRGYPNTKGKKPSWLLRMVAPVGVMLQFCGEHLDRSFISPNRWFDGFVRIYTRFLMRCLRHRFLTLTAFLLVAIAVFGYTAMQMKFQLFKNSDFSFFAINIELPEGTRLEETEQAMALLENYLLDKPTNYIEAVIGRVGLIEDAKSGQMTYGSNRGQVIVDLTETNVRPGITSQDIFNDTRDNMPVLPGVSNVQFQIDSGGPPVGSPVNMRIQGDNYAHLLKISEEVQDYLHNGEEFQKGMKDIKDDFEWGKEEFRVQVDREKAADLGLDVASVAREIRNAFAGGLATTFTRGKEEVEIHVKFTPEYRTSIQDIRIMKFRNQEGELVPFENFAQIVYGQSYSVINRWTQKRSITVSADVDDRIITSNEANELLKKRFGMKSQEFPDVTFEYAGENEDTAESMASFKRAFMAAMFLNYGIIATVFNSFLQPVVVMTAIPFGVLGVIIGHFIHGEPLGFMSLLGLVALIGIVVNNSIILVDFINNARKRGWNRWKSIVWAAKLRVRPIILTSATTIGGLGPMLFGLTGTSSFLVPMAIALVYGLLFSTVLVLLLVPLLVSLLDGIKLYFGVRLVKAEYDQHLLNQSYHLKTTDENI